MENNMNAPLSVRGLCKNYPEFQLKSVSFSLEPGKITGFIGRNGAGKTTTINAVLALIRPDGGEVYFNGLTREEHAREILEKTGFVSAGMRPSTPGKSCVSSPASQSPSIRTGTTRNTGSICPPSACRKTRRRRNFPTA